MTAQDLENTAQPHFEVRRRHSSCYFDQSSSNGAETVRILRSMAEHNTRLSAHPSTLPLHKRFQSIFADSGFVETAASHYNLPVLANERCGSWYVSPDLKQGSAYFKSTDGHRNQWAFNLKRLNLRVLKWVGNNGG